MTAKRALIVELASNLEHRAARHATVTTLLAVAGVGLIAVLLSV